MTIKQCLKFLNTFCFSLENKIMFLCRQTSKIFRAIITLNTIKMMNNPSFGQRFPIGFFPNQYMLTYIAHFCSSVMAWIVNHSITIVIIVATFPKGRFFTFWKTSFIQLPCSPKPKYLTTMTPRRSGTYRFPTIFTIFFVFFSPFSTISQAFREIFCLHIKEYIIFSLLLSSPEKA